jgi:formylglycine-generating enzyme required for sulfatase activity
MSGGQSAHEPRQQPGVAGGEPPAESRSATAEPEGARVVAGAAAWSALAAEPDLEVPLPVPAGHAALAMRFRRIPAGAFVMGSRGNYPEEEPAHRVILPHAFWLGTFVVTQEEWQGLVEACRPAGLEASPSRFKGRRRPVETVSWDDVQAWCEAWHAWLRGDGHDPSLDLRELRLPSEAEWEYACRAGSETEYWNGDGEAALREVGWFNGNAGGETHDVDEPVVAGSPERHPAGVMGMHGNVWEWCGDSFDRGAYRAFPDGWPAEKPWSEWEGGDSKKHRGRVIRGGAWCNSAGWCRSADRGWPNPDGRRDGRGFRVCLVRGPAATTDQAGGGAAPGKRGAEVERAEQDKASGARPPSGAAGETGAAGGARRRAATSPPAAQPRGAKKKPARRRSKGAAPPRQPKGAPVPKSPRVPPRSKQPQAGNPQSTRKPAEQAANKPLKKSTKKPVKKAVKKLPRSRPKTPKSPGQRPGGKKPKG